MLLKTSNKNLTKVKIIYKKALNFGNVDIVKIYQKNGKIHQNFKALKLLN